MSAVAATYQHAAPEATAGMRKRHHHRAWFVAGGILVLGVVLLGIIGAVSGPPKPCHSNCGFTPPPTSPPLNDATAYRSSAFGFRVGYDRNYAGKPTVQNASAVAWHFALRNGGYFDVKVAGSKAGFESAGQIINDIQASDFSQFSAVYTLPAEIGYLPATGEIYTGVWTPLSGSAVAERVAILSTIQNRLAISMECEGPEVNDNGAHPNPARLGVADYFCDNILNAVTWPGEKPR